MPAILSRVPSETLLEVLRAYLPYSLPLYRRLQSPQGNDHHVLATTLPNLKSEGLDSELCFAAAYVERTRIPKTDCWLFLSCESRVDPSQSATKKALCATCTDCLLAIVQELTSIPAPAVVDDPDTIKANAKFLTHKYDRNLILIGSLNTSVASLLQNRGWLSSVHPGLKVTYTKYIFARDSIPSTITDELPEGLRWGKVREKDMELVQTRTGIPRPASSLRKFPSVAIFATDTASRGEQDGTPIAWSFIGVDGSLITLHVEEEYRGRGLAKKLAANLFRTALPEAYDMTGEPEGGYAHADVALTNAASKGVCLSLGAKNPNNWEVCWTRLDLDKVRMSFNE